MQINLLSITVPNDLTVNIFEKILKIFSFTWHVSVRVTIAVMKPMTKSTLRGFTWLTHSCSERELKQGWKPRQELRPRPGKDDAYWPASMTSMAFLRPLSYRTQDHQSRNSTT